MVNIGNDHNSYLKSRTMERRCAAKLASTFPVKNYKKTTSALWKCIVRQELFSRNENHGTRSTHLILIEVYKYKYYSVPSVFVRYTFNLHHFTVKIAWRIINKGPHRVSNSDIYDWVDVGNHKLCLKVASLEAGPEPSSCAIGLRS